LELSRRRKGKKVRMRESDFFDGVCSRNLHSRCDAPQRVRKRALMLIDGRYARGVKPISKVAVVDAVRVLEVGRVWCEGGCAGTRGEGAGHKKKTQAFA